jgi:porin
MARTIPRALLAVLVLAWCALSAQANEAQPDDAGSLFTQDTLTGDWFGFRKRLEQQGVQLGGDEIFDVMANPVGGQKQGAAFEGRFELFANIDLGAALGWHGALLHANAYVIHGNGLSTDDVGNLLTVTNIGATPGTRLFALLLQQSFLDDALSIRLGQLAADDEFFVSQYAALFLNSTFGWPSILGVNLPSGGPAYPLATPGLRIRYAFSPTLIFSTGLFNGDPAPAGLGNPQIRDAGGTAFRLDGGLFWINELAYAASLGEDNLPGSYKLGGWFHDGAFADQRFDNLGQTLSDPASSGVPALHRDNFGFYAIADQLLWRASGSSDKGLGVFFRAGGNPADRNLIEFHLDGGVTCAGLVPGRDNDTLGLGMSYERVSTARRDLGADANAVSHQGLPLPDFESALELSYQAQLAPWWVAEPDAQFIIHPGARLASLFVPPATTSVKTPANALIVGMRTAVSF